MDHNSPPSNFIFRPPPPPPLAVASPNIDANNHQQPPVLSSGHVRINDTIMVAPARSRRRKSTLVAFVGEEEKEEGAKGKEEEVKEDRKMKKMMHRDVEKQRRQEMSGLYSSLRSLLPFDYLKGKRSVSDHIHQAANYIKHQEGKIEELSCKRDQLKNTYIPTTTGNSSASASASASSSSTSNLSANNYNFHDRSKSTVIINVTTCLIGIEVTLEVCEFHMGVSTIVGALAGEGFNIVSCISARVNHRMVHTIKAEACDGRSIDAAQLQEKLRNSVVLRRSAPDKTAGSY